MTDTNMPHHSFALWAEHSGIRRLRWLLPIVGTLAVVIVLIIRYWEVLNLDKSEYITVGFAVLLAALLSFLPALICYVQNVSRKRQLNRLNSLESLPISKTALFQSAVRKCNSAMLVVDADYAIPIFLLFLVTFIGFMTILIAYSHPALFQTASVVLGGLHDANHANFAQYQMQTFCVVAMAFLGSYIYALGRLLNRINNNDLYPISIYYYITRVIIACVAAAVLRHTIGVFADASNSVLPTSFSEGAAPMLLLIGFGLGFAPDLFILAMTRKAFQTLKIWGSRDDPPDSLRPTGLSLLMIDDLSREKIDRLNELEIDSAHALARQNPFRLLLTLPYELSLLVDWIAQANLYVLVKDTGLKSLREIYIRDIFDLYIYLVDDQSRPDICAKLQFSDAAGQAMITQLDQDASYLRLLELRNAMKPACKPDLEDVSTAASTKPHRTATRAFPRHPSSPGASGGGTPVSMDQPTLVASSAAG
jgi:hypothetical protein